MASTPETSFSHSATYHAFWVRLWRDRNATVWYASVQDARTDEIVRFESLSALFAFFETVTTQSATGDQPAE